jgi:small subunit ribosomal protein S17
MAEVRYGRQKTRVGVVVKDKMAKTVVVAVGAVKRHRLYKKIMRRVTHYKAHDEENACRVGDKVLIVETRPLSRDKRWRVAEILVTAALPEEERAIIDEEVAEELRVLDEIIAPEAPPAKEKAVVAEEELPAAAEEIEGAPLAEEEAEEAPLPEEEAEEAPLAEEEAEEAPLPEEEAKEEPLAEEEAKEEPLAEEEAKEAPLPEEEAEEAPLPEEEESKAEEEEQPEKEETKES